MQRLEVLLVEVRPFRVKLAGVLVHDHPNGALQPGVAHIALHLGIVCFGYRPDAVVAERLELPVIGGFDFQNVAARGHAVDHAVTVAAKEAVMGGKVRLLSFDVVARLAEP